MGGRRRRGLADLIGEVGAETQERETQERETQERETQERETQERETQEREREEPGLKDPAPPGARGIRPGGGGEAAMIPPATEEAGRDAGAAPRPIPKYLALERKEARLRSDQVDSLSALARRVNRRKVSRGGERITENTLIRVAVDLLLSQERYVGGSTEEEIRRALGVPGDPRAG